MDKLLNILLELHPDVDFFRQHTLIDDGILDSFDIVTLVAEIEDSYGVLIPAHALTPENFNSTESIYSLIQYLTEN